MAKRMKDKSGLQMPSKIPGMFKGEGTGSSTPSMGSVVEKSPPKRKMASGSLMAGPNDGQMAGIKPGKMSK